MSFNKVNALTNEEAVCMFKQLIRHLWDPSYQYDLHPLLTTSEIIKIIGLLRSGLQDQLNGDRLYAFLIFHGLEKDKVRLLQNIWSQNYSKMSKLVLEEALNLGRLVDFDWKLGTTVSTDQVKDAGVMFIQVILKIKDNKTTEIRKLHFEMNVSQFYR